MQCTSFGRQTKASEVIMHFRWQWTDQIRRGHRDACQLLGYIRCSSAFSVSVNENRTIGGKEVGTTKRRTAAPSSCSERNHNVAIYPLEALGQSSQVSNEGRYDPAPAICA